MKIPKRRRPSSRSWKSRNLPLAGGRQRLAVALPALGVAPGRVTPALVVVARGGASIEGRRLGGRLLARGAGARADVGALKRVAPDHVVRRLVELVGHQRSARVVAGTLARHAAERPAARLRVGRVLDADTRVVGLERGAGRVLRRRRRRRSALDGLADGLLVLLTEAPVQVGVDTVDLRPGLRRWLGSGRRLLRGLAGLEVVSDRLLVLGPETPVELGVDAVDLGARSRRRLGLAAREKAPGPPPARRPRSRPESPAGPRPRDAGRARSRRRRPWGAEPARARPPPARRSRGRPESPAGPRPRDAGRARSRRRRPSGAEPARARPRAPARAQAPARPQARRRPASVRRRRESAGGSSTEQEPVPVAGRAAPGRRARAPRSPRARSASEGALRLRHRRRRPPEPPRRFRRAGARRRHRRPPAQGSGAGPSAQSPPGSRSPAGRLRHPPRDRIITRRSRPGSTGTSAAGVRCARAPPVRVPSAPVPEARRAPSPA